MPLHKHSFTIGASLSTGLLALLLLVMVAIEPSGTRAQEEVCGNAFLEVGEQCDDGNTESGDGCSQTCGIERCGNGRIDVTEQCDDGNTESGDGCSRICRLEFCGDTQTQQDIGEECDDGNNVSGDGCSSFCQMEGAEGSPPPPRPPVNQPKPRPPTHSLPALPAVNPRVLAEPETQQLLLRVGFSEEDQSQLRQLLESLSKKKALSPLDREEAARFIQVIASAEASDRERIASLISDFLSDVSDGSFERLEAAVAARDSAAMERELRAINPPTGSALRQLIVDILARIERFHPEVSKNITQDIRGKLFGSPEEMLMGLLELRQRIDVVATKEYTDTLERIQDAARSIEKQRSELGNTDALTGDIARALSILAKEPSNVRARESILAMGPSESIAEALSGPDPSGGTEELRQLLLGDTRLQELRMLVSAEGDSQFKDRFAVLLQDLDHLGAGDITPSPCDDSPEEFLACTTAYAEDLEERVRKTSLLMRLGSGVRQFFNLDQ